MKVLLNSIIDRSIPERSNFVWLAKLYCELNYEWLVLAWARWLSTDSIGLIGITSIGNWSLRLLAATDFSNRAIRPHGNHRLIKTHLELTIIRLFGYRKVIRQPKDYTRHTATENRAKRVVCRLRARAARAALFPMFVFQFYFSRNKAFFWRNKT